MKKIRILHLIPTLRVGGAERQLVTLLRSMDTDRFEHQVAVMTRPGPLAKEVEEAGIPVHHFHFRNRHLPWKILEMARYFERNRIDIVHAHLHLAGIWGRVAAAWAGIPVTLYTEHSHVRGRSIGWRIFERLLADHTSLKISVSEARRLESIRYESFPPGKVVTIHNSVVVDDFIENSKSRLRSRQELGIAPDEILIGNVSVLRTPKRIDQLIEVVGRIHAKDSRIRLIVAGDGEEKARLEELVTRQKLEGVVRLLGIRMDIPELMQAMDIYAITSEVEGIPINLLEAMASSLPVVSSEVGGIGEVVEHRRTGLLFDYGDLDRCESHILDLMNHTEKNKELGLAARSFVCSEHSSTVNATRLQENYLRLLEESRRLS